MRQGQSQNRQRSRGRGNRNNRNNNSNNLNRSMESNGPDVRIRGTASHIADKYQQLARDSHSSGDIVAAESYWQHAEHYNRLIAAAQAAQNQAREEQQARQAAEAESNPDRSESDEGGEDRNSRSRDKGRRKRNQERDDRADDSSENENTTDSVNGSGPQPTIDDTPAEVALAEKPVNGSGDDVASTKTRRSKRPRKGEEGELAAAASDAKRDLPSFISGGADE